jgi:hypothetical protein
MRNSDANSDDDVETVELTPEELQEKKIAEERKALEEQNKPLYEQIANICREISEEHPFDILKQPYMDILNHDR